MDVHKLKRVKRIAYRVREKCELYALNVISRDLDPKELMGLCAIASFTLCTELEKAGIEAEVYEGKYDTWFEHCWVVVDDKIVDITATQFGTKRRVSVRKDTSEWYEGSSCTECELRDWVSWQRPSRSKSRRIMALKK
jgi:hypothetical protein